nr:MAG TPA: hypothetical protein [Caudoviricetes sp.]DAJ84570.1 MAG TPA: hypothetical protein [Caudoviricetes sp.]
MFKAIFAHSFEPVREVCAHFKGGVQVAGRYRDTVGAGGVRGYKLFKIICHFFKSSVFL